MRAHLTPRPHRGHCPVAERVAKGNPQRNPGPALSRAEHLILTGDEVSRRARVVGPFAETVVSYRGFAVLPCSTYLPHLVNAELKTQN